MRIDSIELFHIALPLRQPLPKALDAGDKLETIVVAIHSGGCVGWGEASPGRTPRMNPEWAAGAFVLLRDRLAPAVAGQDIQSGDQITEFLATFQGNQFAKSALDTAWWDLDARLKDQPLHQLLGGARQAVEVGPTFDRMESIEEFSARINAAVEAGFPRIKLKFRPGWDVNMVDFVRKECPAANIQIDCEGSLGLQHMDMLYRLEDFALAMIEQPLPADDLVGHAMAQESLRTPICLDEGIRSIAQADMALELHSCKYVNLKPGRVGGLTPAVAIHDLCQDHGIPCWIGATPQTAIGARIGFALASKGNCTYPGDYFPSNEYLATDVAEPLLPERDAADGVERVRLWSAPGIGVEPDRAVLESHGIARAEILPA